MALSHPVISLGGSKIAVDVPHLAFVTAIVAWCVWFCRDAWLAQADVENLIMIVPASAAAGILYVFVAAGCFKAVGPTDRFESRRPLKSGVGVKIAGTMALLAALVVAGPLIGFDLASFVYILATMLLLGERRIIALLLVPALFCIVVIYCFDTILPIPLPLLFGADGAP
jgi:hypothetical protein